MLRRRWSITDTAAMAGSISIGIMGIMRTIIIVIND
jgi:hypothetical protein